MTREHPAPCESRPSHDTRRAKRSSACADRRVCCPDGMLARREWPTDADQYDLMEECGRGVSATVRCAVDAS